MYFVPRPTLPFLDGRGTVNQEWYDYLAQLTGSDNSTEFQAQIDDLAARIRALESEPSSAGDIIGLGSILVTGSIQDGVARVLLQNDADSPGISFYYGTDATGVKGWFPRSLASLSDVDITTPFTAGAAPVFDGVVFKPQAILANPMTTQGDLIVGGASGVATRVVAGTIDYVWTSNGPGLIPAWKALPASSGTVTSVGLALPSIFTVTGSPVTGSGTLTGTLATQASNLVWAGPATGASAAPTFRTLVAADMPAISLSSGVSGILPIANGGTGTASPGLIAGTNVTITGAWPNQTINATGGGGGGSGVWGAITGTITAQTDLMQRFATASLLDCPFL